MNMKTEQHVAELAYAIVRCQELCGNESRAIREYITDEGLKNHPERDRIRRDSVARAESIWHGYQIEAGVTAPISREERANIIKIMERAP